MRRTESESKWKILEQIIWTRFYSLWRVQRRAPDYLCAYSSLWGSELCVSVCLCGQRTRKLRKGWVSDCWMKFDICPDYKMILRTCLIPRRQHYTLFISSRPANTDGWLASGSLEIRPSHAHVLTAHTRICLLFLLETLTGIKWHFKFSHVAFIQPTSSLR